MEEIMYRIIQATKEQIKEELAQEEYDIVEIVKRAERQANKRIPNHLKEEVFVTIGLNQENQLVVGWRAYTPEEKQLAFY